MYLISYGFIIICVAVCIYLNQQYDSLEAAVKLGALYPPRVKRGEYWRLLAAGFIHIQYYHLIANIYSLYNFRFMERLLGSGKYLLVVILAILGGNLLTYKAGNKHSITIGISGGIYGLIGVYVILLIKFIGYRSLPTVANMLLPGIIVSFLPNVSLTGHLGGLITGIILGLILI